MEGQGLHLRPLPPGAETPARLAESRISHMERRPFHMECRTIDPKQATTSPGALAKPLDRPEFRMERPADHVNQRRFM